MGSTNKSVTLYRSNNVKLVMNKFVTPSTRNNVKQFTTPVMNNSVPPSTNKFAKRSAINKLDILVEPLKLLPLDMPEPPNLPLVTMEVPLPAEMFVGMFLDNNARMFPVKCQGKNVNRFPVSSVKMFPDKKPDKNVNRFLVRSATMYQGKNAKMCLDKLLPKNARMCQVKNARMCLDKFPDK